MIVFWGMTFRVNGGWSKKRLANSLKRTRAYLVRLQMLGGYLYQTQMSP